MKLSYSALAKILLTIYDLAYIERWNDHPKPFHITELDKQAHKSAIAYIVGRIEEHSKGIKLNWDYLIEAIIFEALQRAILTDIKPQVFHRIMRERKKEVAKLLKEKLSGPLGRFDRDLKERFEAYLYDEEERKEKRVVRASHFLATYWEFQMIYSVGIRFYGIEKVKEEIETTIEDFFDLDGVQRIYLKKKTFNFIDLVGQLRFQKRWILTPRLPTTSVLGHMFVVATLSYLLSLKIGACERRKFLNFFCGLFHDLPEVTTRDIIAPIKDYANIKDVIKEYEREQVEDLILPLLPPYLKKEFAYILGFIEGISSEFSNRIVESGSPKEVKDLDKYNKEEFWPLDGFLVKGCDVIGAYVEARLSKYHGLRSRHIEEGIKKTKRSLKEKKYLGIDFVKIAENVDKLLS